MTPPIRDLRELAACRAVVDLQVDVWGPNAEIVPASVLLVTVKRGGILLGAYDGSSMVGFVWSIPGWREGRPTQWSHMLGVAPAWRGRGLGEALKLAQRERALSLGVELIEWTFDPLQAVNAHLNLHRLGAVARVYQPNLYGEMDSPLMHGTPTDRLVAEWWISRPRARPDLTGAHVKIPVPPNFTTMLRDAPAEALACRLAVREAFTAHFSRGCRAVDFLLDRAAGGGAYVLTID